jgi:hypothetical protein
MVAEILSVVNVAVEILGAKIRDENDSRRSVEPISREEFGDKRFGDWSRFTGNSGYWRMIRNFTNFIFVGYRSVTSND